MEICDSHARARKIAILGATGHIAKGLIHGICRNRRYELFLFARTPARVHAFLAGMGHMKPASVRTFDDFSHDTYDVIINCVGIGDPGKLERELSSIFCITETYDNLALKYLEDHPGAVYINLSSGAAYGASFSTPADEKSHAGYDINNLNPAGYYGIAKLYSEAKHRSLRRQNIVDLRIFGYFSRFIDLEAKFMMSEIIFCIKSGMQFVTGPDNVVRDYVHPEDLVSLVEKCIEGDVLNEAFDVYSAKPVSKFEILEVFSASHGLDYVVDEGHRSISSTGNKKNYYSVSRKAEILGYSPRFTSLQALVNEASAVMESYRPQGRAL